MEDYPSPALTCQIQGGNAHAFCQQFFLWGNVGSVAESTVNQHPVPIVCVAIFKNSWSLPGTPLECIDDSLYNFKSGEMVDVPRFIWQKACPTDPEGD